MTNSIKKIARIGGLLYLTIILAGIFAQFFVRERLIVPEDSTATGYNIIAHQFLFRLGFTADFIGILLDIPMEIIFYLLLRHVNKNLALLVVVFAFFRDAIMSVNQLNYFAPFLLLGGSKYLSVFNTNQLNALVSLCFNAHTIGLLISMVFFGFHCSFLGYLIIKSDFFQKVIGILLIVACFCLLLNSFVYFLAPQLDIPELILLPDFFAELFFCLWLLVKGVKVQKWNEQLSNGQLF